MGMALSFNSIRGVLISMSCVVALSALTGCQFAQSVPTARLIQHQAMVDPAGLKDSQTCEAVKVHVATPQKWDQLAAKKTAVYTDMQWRSPSKQTGVGVAYIHLPLPIPASAIAWMAQKEYSKRAEDGKLLSTWTDSLGRPWFEAENNRFHVRGYIISKGFEAWIIYCGYRLEQPPSAAELGVAARALETIVPTPFSQDIPQRPMASGSDAASDTQSADVKQF
jgi:hypothetical protein